MILDAMTYSIITVVAMLSFVVVLLARRIETTQKDDEK